ncbi:unnamed protein product, partial [Ectocarpus sp. 8 AP-2014]
GGLGDVVIEETIKNYSSIEFTCSSILLFTFLFLLILQVTPQRYYRRFSEIKIGTMTKGRKHFSSIALEGRLQQGMRKGCATAAGLGDEVGRYCTTVMLQHRLGEENKNQRD